MTGNELKKIRIQPLMEGASASLACGLGGGLDILNASILYFAGRANKCAFELGSCRATAQGSFSGHETVTSQLCWMTKDTKIKIGGRHAELHICKELETRVIYISRGQPCNAQGLREATEAAAGMFSRLFFVDGGGDSLILQRRKKRDPFKVAEMLNALRGISNAYLAVVAAGVDIPLDLFHENLDQIREKGGYYGSVNIATGEKKEYTLDHILPFPENNKEYLSSYFELAEKVLVLKEEDLRDKSKTKSNMATITYHALKGNFGPQRTYMEPDGKPIQVNEGHCWMYFFNPSVVEDIKREILNNSNTKKMNIAKSGRRGGKGT